MIQIFVRPDEIGPEWREKSIRLTEELIECKDDEDGTRTAADKRREIIDRNQRHWGSIRETLMRWSHQKCWYSELRDSGSDYHVDHFRPKGRVRDEGEPEREGYWWLAFDWTNYRMAVSWVNSPHREVGRDSQGKVDHFPLKPGSLPAGIGDPLEGEQPVLIDPTKARDVMLVDYDENGLPVPATTGWNAERVIGTRKLLHLDSQRMIDARLDTWRKCQRLIQRANEAVSAEVAEYTPYHEKSSDDWISEICEMLRQDYPLSSVARACIAKSEYPWIKHLLTYPLSTIEGAAQMAAAKRRL